MRKTTTRLLLAAASFAVATPAMASEDGQYWQTATINVNLPSNFKLQNETVFRTSDAKGFYEIENNLMLGRKLNKNVTVWLGYTFDPQYSHGNFTVREHRIREQVNVDNFAHIGKAKFSGRLRLEERFREGIAGTGWRFRPAVKVSMPFIGKTTFSLQHESFIDLNTTSFQKTGGYDRMRNSAYVTVPVAKRVSFDLGYLSQYTFVQGGPNNNDNVFTLGLTASF